jgi:hypothetical protein
MNLYNTLVGVLFIAIVLVSLWIRFIKIERKFKYDISMQNLEKQLAVIKTVIMAIVIIAIIRFGYWTITHIFS